MYDKADLVLRIETVINNPEDFRVRKKVLRKGKQRTEWVEMRKALPICTATVRSPLARHDAQLFQSLMAGEHCLRGFTNRYVRAQLASTAHLRACGHDLESKVPRLAAPSTASMLTV